MFEVFFSRTHTHTIFLEIFQSILCYESILWILFDKTSNFCKQFLNAGKPLHQHQVYGVRLYMRTAVFAHSNWATQILFSYHAKSDGSVQFLICFTSTLFVHLFVDDGLGHWFCCSRINFAYRYCHRPLRTWKQNAATNLNRSNHVKIIRSKIQIQKRFCPKNGTNVFSWAP